MDEGENVESNRASDGESSCQRDREYTIVCQDVVVLQRHVDSCESSGPRQSVK
jgi:hypothetical protein